MSEEQQGGFASQRIATLKRRRDWLEVRTLDQDESWDVAEMGALTLAIRVLENAKGLGMLPSLALLTERDVEVIAEIERGLTIVEIAGKLGVSKWTVKERAARLCEVYGCDTQGLPAKVRERRSEQ